MLFLVYFEYVLNFKSYASIYLHVVAAFLPLEFESKLLRILLTMFICT